MKRTNPPIVLTIAGSDSSGGAGIQADIKAISATGCYAASVITALTAQNTRGVQRIHEVSPAFLEQQMISVFDDIEVDAIKIGMLHRESIILTVSKILKKYRAKNIVIDPVMVAKSGHALLNENTIETLKSTLFPLAALITPNLPEAEKLLNQTLNTSQQQKQAAIELGKRHGINVLVKGGHVKSEQAADVVYIHEKATTMWFEAERVVSHNTHGTGCSLSSAIASYLAKGYPLSTAIQQAKEYLTSAIIASKEWRVGKGYGPVDHFYNLKK